jgi:peptide/nickel transport system permease protein
VSGWLLRRTASAIATALAAAAVLFVLVHYLPGDPLAAVLRDRPATPDVLAALRQRWCVDCSLPHSFARYFGALAHGDLGPSPSENRPVAMVLAEHLRPTLLLGALTLLIDFTVGLALGLWAALRPQSRAARMVSALSIAGYAIPAFVVGMILVWLFAVTLGWLPPGAIADPLLPADAPTMTVLFDRLRHLILPLATMVIATIAVPLRQQRAAVLAVAAEPWVLAARARGVPPLAVAWRHCWRPALTPVVTLLGLWLPMLVAGTVFVESVFAWPGLGSLIATATEDHDVPLVMGAGLLLIVMVQLGSLIADLLYRVVDPAQRAA